MGRSILMSVLVGVGCALVVWVLGRLLDSSTLMSLTVPSGVGSAIGYFITTLTGRGRRRGPGS